MVHNMNAVRRSILRRLLLRMEGMKRGFTFIERDRNGATVEDVALEPFNSFAECCAAAERALSTGSARLLELIDVVPCRYDKSWCHPDALFVMKTFRRTA